MMVEQEIPGNTGPDDSFLKIIGCPRCKTGVRLNRYSLHCDRCQNDYPVVDEIPALLLPDLSLGLSMGQPSVKHFYYAEERYDWTSDPRGLELVYHRYRRWETWRQIVRMLKPENTILDLGCGTGLITCKFIGWRQKVIAVDLNRWALSRMDGKPWVKKVQADGEALPIQDESVDLAVATEMIEHLENPENAAAELFRVCKKGGHVVGSVPSTSNVWRWRRFLSMTCGGGEPFHHNYSRAEVSALWKKAGFKSITIQRSCFGLNWLWILEKP